MPTVVSTAQTTPDTSTVVEAALPSIEALSPCPRETRELFGSAVATLRTPDAPRDQQFKALLTCAVAAAQVGDRTMTLFKAEREVEALVEGTKRQSALLSFGAEPLARFGETQLEALHHVMRSQHPELSRVFKQESGLAAAFAAAAHALGAEVQAIIPNPARGSRKQDIWIGIDVGGTPRWVAFSRFSAQREAALPPEAALTSRLPVSMEEWVTSILREQYDQFARKEWSDLAAATLELEYLLHPERSEVRRLLVAELEKSGNHERAREIVEAARGEPVESTAARIVAEAP